MANKYLKVCVCVGFCGRNGGGFCGCLFAQTVSVGMNMYLPSAIYLADTP